MHERMYYFDYFNGRDLISDPEGRQLGSLASIEAEADADARELLVTAILKDEPIVGREVRVRDSWGNSVLRLAFVDLVDRRQVA